MAETIHVRGEGGSVFTMDLPLPEGIAERYERGLLVRVNADGTPYAGGTREGAQEEDGSTASSSDLSAGRVPKPGANAPKAEWIAYVVSLGHLSADDAANYTKADLIEMGS